MEVKDRSGQSCARQDQDHGCNGQILTVRQNKTMGINDRYGHS